MVSKKKGKKGQKSGPKVSLVKLSNKKLNRLAKQGKLKKTNKSQLVKLLNSRTKQPPKPGETPTEHKGDAEEEEPVAPDIPLEEADYDYFATPGRDFSFLSTVSDASPETPKKRRKRKATEDENDGIESEYAKKLSEQTPQKQMKALLPIKGKQGVVARMVEVKEEEEVEPEVKVKEEAVEDPAEPLPALTTAELFVLRRRKLAERKEKIALLASAILENPEEHMSKLRELRMMMEEDEADICITVKKLAIISLLEIFKDIIPSYRIREVSAKEKQQTAKKETKTLRGFEESLVNNYKHYIDFLTALAAGKVPTSKDRKKRARTGAPEVAIPKEVTQTFRELSARCLCELLVMHPHFNFRTEIIAAVVPLVGHRSEQISVLVCDSIKKIFRADKEGEVTLEIVRLIGRMIKARQFHIHPRVLKTFLSLKIKEVETEDQKQSNKAEKRRKFAMMSKRDKKRKKQMAFLEKELQEASATVDRKKKLKVHTEIINMVFLTYFRILKFARDSVLLSTVLEGLAKFAHLINIDFFEDLFAVLNELIDSEDLSYRESLHCVQTAFKILSGQGQALNVDPLRFFRHLYKTLFELSAGHTEEDLPIALHCLDIMINKRKRQVSHQRVMAFTKRLMTLALRLESHAALATLAATREFLQSDPKADILLDTEAQGSGIFMPELEDPEHCNAASTALFELHLLRRHYHPTTRKYSRHLMAGAPSSGAGQLPPDLIRKSSSELYKTFDPTTGHFHPPLEEKPPGRSKKGHASKSGEYLQNDLFAEIQSQLQKMEAMDISHINFSAENLKTKRPTKTKPPKVKEANGVIKTVNNVEVKKIRAKTRKPKTAENGRT